VKGRKVARASLHQQLNEQENWLEALRWESGQIEAEQTKEQASFDKMIQDLSFDVKP
jgi:hypothetical protein